MKRVDDLQVNGLKLVQDTDLFCFGCDAVELANFCGERKPKTVCDLGTGNGIIAVLLAGKFGCKVTAVEIQDECVKLAKENARLNNLDIEVLHMPMQQLSGRTFDAVTLNPPYRKLGSGVMQTVNAVAVARHEISVTLREAVQTASRLLSSGGKFFMVQQTERLAETLHEVKLAKLEPKVLQILTPNEKKAPHLFLLECHKDGSEGLTVLRERSIKAYGCD